MSRSIPLTMTVGDFDTTFPHRVSAIEARSGKKIVEVVVRQDNRHHGPYYGRVDRNVIMAHGEKAKDPKMLRLVLTCHPKDREALERRVQNPKWKAKVVDIEAAPGRTMENVGD